VIRWSRSRRTGRYAVNLRLHDGRRVTHLTRRRRLVVGQVPAIDGGTVRVAGLRADNLAGPARQATLRPRPKVELSAGRRQRLGQLAVVAGCGAQACRLRASGTVTVEGSAGRFKLRPASARVAALERKRLRLNLTRGARRKLIKLLKRGRRARATVVVGNAGAGGKGERLRVRLKQ